jgi:hypothetical protein
MRNSELKKALIFYLAPLTHLSPEKEARVASPSQVPLFCFHAQQTRNRLLNPTPLRAPMAMLQLLLLLLLILVMFVALQMQCESAARISNLHAPGCKRIIIKRRIFQHHKPWS